MNKIPNRPDPNAAFPNPKIPSLCFIKNVVKNPRIIIGDFTYYDDPNGADQFEKQVTHFYDFIGDKLIIGKFRAIAPVKDELPLKETPSWLPTSPVRRGRRQPVQGYQEAFR